MTCHTFESDISKLLDNELPEDRQGATFSHLTSCVSCREFFHTSRFVRRHLEDMPAYPEKLDQIVLHAPGDRTVRKPIFSRRILVPLPAAAAVLLVLALSIFFTVDAYDDVRSVTENVIYVPTLPEVQVEATIAANNQSEERPQ